MDNFSRYSIGMGIIGLLVHLAGSGYGDLLICIAAVWLAWETWKPKKTSTEIFDASRKEVNKFAVVSEPPLMKKSAHQSPNCARKAAAFAAERDRVRQAVQERQAQALKNSTLR